MPDKLAELRYEIALASRMIAYEGVLDAFGHVSARHPTDPGRYLLPRARSPELVEPADVLEFTLDSELAGRSTERQFSERVIHGEIYKARPDVMAVCHHHGSAIMPYCITGEPYAPVFHLGAAPGQVVPFWNQRDEFGDTNMLVVKREEGASLARALGKHTMVLMRNHGATVVAPDPRQLVFRCIYSCRNAEYQTEAKRIGTVGTLTPGEIDKASMLNFQPNVVARTWEYWTVRLGKAGELPSRGGPAQNTAKARSLPVARSKAGKRSSPAKRQKGKVGRKK